jgi:hypothetical protein
MMKSPPLATIAAILLANFSVLQNAHAAEVLRTYTADITATAPDGDITFVHEPSGYTVAAHITAATEIWRTRYFPPGEIPDGQTIRIENPEIDGTAQTVTARECAVESIAQEELVANPGQHKIAGKLFRFRPGTVSASKSGQAAGDWTALDQGTSLGLETADGKRWKLKWTLVTPLAHALERGTARDLLPGRRAGITVADDGDGRGELRRATVEVWFPGAELRNAPGRCPVSGPSGITPAEMQSQMAAVRKQFAGMKDALAREMPVTMRVEPELALAGEPVKLDFRVLSAKAPNPKVSLYADYLHAGISHPQEITIPWQLTGTDAGLPVYTASLSLPSDKVGQYLVQWDCESGGDIPSYSRSYAICDSKSAVCVFVICGGEPSGPKAQFHRDFVPFDYWTDILHLPELSHGSAEGWAQQSRESRQFGDNPEFQITPGVDTEPADVQCMDVDAVKELATLLGYPERPISAWSYTLGNAGYREMEAAGGMTATCLCTENHIDGGMEINCWGKPERPYFMSNEDFRKPGPGGPEKLVAFSQLQRHTELAQHYLCDYGPEAASFGGNLLCATGHDRTYDELAFSRMLDAYNALFQMTQSQKAPYFICDCVQMDGARPGATEGNQLIIQYAIDKARKENVVFANTAGASEFYQRHYNATPETTCYFTDWWAGTHMNDKPDLFPDTMTMENGTFYALALANQILPESAYDYTTKWDYPDFGNETQPRRLHDPNSYLLPGKYDKFAATPRLVDTRPFQAARRDRMEDGALVVTISVDARKAERDLPLALWNVPREFRPGGDWFQASQGCRFVPIAAPYTGNLNGFLIADVTAGRNLFTLRIDSPARAAQVLDFKIGDGVRGKVIHRDRREMAYIWPGGPWPATLRLHLPPGKSAQAYVAPEGALQQCGAGESSIEIPQGEWMRVIGLSRDEILRFATAEHP